MIKEHLIDPLFSKCWAVCDRCFVEAPVHKGPTDGWFEAGANELATKAGWSVKYVGSGGTHHCPMCKQIICLHEPVFVTSQYKSNGGRVSVYRCSKCDFIDLSVFGFGQCLGDQN